MPDPLRLPCSLAQGDHLTVDTQGNDEPDARMVQLLADVICASGGDKVQREKAEIWLSADDARRLFNWLGAFLHGV